MYTSVIQNGSGQSRYLHGDDPLVAHALHGGRDELADLDLTAAGQNGVLVIPGGASGWDEEVGGQMGDTNTNREQRCLGERAAKVGSQKAQPPNTFWVGPPAGYAQHKRYYNEHIDRAKGHMLTI